MSISITQPITVAADSSDSSDPLGDAGFNTSDTTVFIGFSITETAGSTAEVKIRHGAADTSPLLVSPIKMAASGFGTFWYGNGISANSGIYVERVSGTTELVLYVRNL